MIRMDDELMNSAKRIDWPRLLLAACRRIERADGTVSLADLSRGLGVSGAELQRQFRRRLGASPKAYGQALALHRLVRGARGSATALEATLGAGFESVSAAYALVKASFGVTPGRLRKIEEVHWWLGLSDLGWMLMGATPAGICWLAFGDDPSAMRADLRAAFPAAALRPEEQQLRRWFDRVRDFILLPRDALDLPVDIQGTAFQARVWQALRKVPIGATVSYTDIAARLDEPRAARAVASACARNPLAVLIPCHRVIGVDGRLAGYRWGVERKKELLRREGLAKPS